MTLSNKQKELDKIKWEKSQLLGIDACGSFDYCKCCNKSLDNPCEIALNKFNGNYEEKQKEEIKEEKPIVEIKKVEKKTPAKKTCSTKKSATKRKTTKK